MTPKQALDEAISIAGGQKALGEKIGRPQQTISHWSRKGQCAPEAALDIERETGVSRHSLRPDLYPLEAA